MRPQTLVLCVTLLLGALAQETDTIKFARARTALSQKDCAVAIEALQEISPAGKNDPLWLTTAADAYECNGDLVKALAYFSKYAELFPANAEIIRRLGDLSYRAKKAANVAADATKAARWRTDPSGDWFVLSRDEIVPDLSVRATVLGDGVRFVYTRTPNGHSGAADVLFEGKLYAMGQYKGQVTLDLVSGIGTGPEPAWTVNYDVYPETRFSGQQSYFGVPAALLAKVPAQLPSRKVYPARGELTSRGVSDPREGVQFIIDRFDGTCCGIKVDEWTNTHTYSPVDVFLWRVAAVNGGSARD